jgi:hypothetical protein
MRAFLDIAPCSLVKVDRRFRGAYRGSTPTRLHGAVSQKAVIFVVGAMRTWNLTPLNRPFSDIDFLCLFLLQLVNISERIPVSETEYPTKLKGCAINI